METLRRLLLHANEFYDSYYHYSNMISIEDVKDAYIYKVGSGRNVAISLGRGRQEWFNRARGYLLYRASTKETNGGGTEISIVDIKYHYIRQELLEREHPRRVVTPLPASCYLQFLYLTQVKDEASLAFPPV